MTLGVGDVLERHAGPRRPIRILMLDPLEVFYDAWWGDDGWGFGIRRRSGTYYRMSYAEAAESHVVRHEPLTPRELALHRPDLPLRVYRHPTMNWADLALDSPAQVASALLAKNASGPGFADLNASDVILESPPLWSGNVHGKVSAAAGGCLTAGEVLWHAQRLIARLGVEADNGIGLFRSGFRQGVPTYYIGGFHDIGGSTWYHENGHAAGALPVWNMRKKLSGSYRQRLRATRREYPFKSWAESAADGLEQYSRENCAAVAAVFDQLITRLIDLGEMASEADKVAAFREAVLRLNELDAQLDNLIETEEREQLCALCNSIASAAGLDSTKFGRGEGLASEWRNW